jgi:competence protein ComEC
VLALPAPRPVVIAIAFALGLAAAPILDRSGGPPSARWVAAIAVGFLAIRHRRWVIPAVVAVGAAYGAVTPPDRTGADDRVVDRIVGEVVGPVLRTARGWGARIDEVWVWSTEPIEPGERLEVAGYLATPSGPRGPGLVDPEVILRTRGARLELTARSITRLADDPDLMARWWRWARAQQHAWVADIDRAGGDPLGRAALRGIAVGDRLAIPPELDARWRSAGIYHVLSVSGLHLAVVAGLLYVLLRRLLAASPWGGRIRPARWAAPIALALAIAYTAITGAQLATLRALIVVGVMFTGAMLDRPARLADALAIAALAILAWRPGDLFDPGFQLSFAAAIVLAVRPQDQKPGIRAWIARGLATSAWVTLATAPITAFHFHEVTAGGLIGNLVLTPLVELIALPMSLAGLAIGWDLPVYLSSELVGVVDTLAEQIAVVAPVGRIAIANPVVLAALVTVSIGLAARRIPRPAGWLVLCLAWSLGRVPAPDGALRVTFVDVGQGDAAIVELPDGTVLLIDAGGFASARDPNIGARPGRTIARVLTAYDRDAIDIAMISHPHPDHYLGLAGLGMPVRELWFAPEQGDHTASSFRALAEALEQRGTKIVHPPLGIALARAGVEVEVLAPRYRPAPDAPVELAADPVRSANDNSLVIAIRYGGRTVLFTGDVEAEGEDLLVAGGLGPVDVVKVAHHGSPTSSSASFVAAARPALAVISCGRNNQFQFPSAAVLARWHAVGATIARTDLEGSIAVVIDPAGQISVERLAVPP